MTPRGFFWLGIVALLAALPFLRHPPPGIVKVVGCLAITGVCFIAYALMKRGEE